MSVRTEQEVPRNIPSLDGLRAIAVFAVILGHIETPIIRFLPHSFRNAYQGVSVFFVLSGFLITHLLLKEIDHTGRVDLKKFYFRRTMRIFPPFYVFIGVVAVLGGLHIVHVTGAALAAAATYTWNYVRGGPEVWALGHCWSLCLEEQFYLLWPASMAFFSKRTNFRIALGVILLSPFSRVLTYFLWPSMRDHMNMMLHTHLDIIMFGCLLSLMLNLKVGEALMQRALQWWAPVAALVFLMAIDTPAILRFRGMYEMTVGYSLRGLAIAVIVLFSVFRHSSPLGKFLNLKVVRHLGLISYSIYLWQQLFTGPYTRFFPLNLLAIVAVAEVSYWVVERPTLALRERIAHRLFAPSAASPAAATSTEAIL